jgi:hypothetical protein
MRTRILLSVACLIALVVPTAVSKVAKKVKHGTLAYQISNAAPIAYTVVLDEVIGSSTVASHRSTQQIRAKRSNGDSLLQTTEFDSHDGSRVISIERKLSIGNLVVRTYDLASAKSTIKLSSDELTNEQAKQYTAASNCSRTVSGWPTDPQIAATVVGHEPVDGFDTFKLTNSANMTMWRAPAFGCETIQFTRTLGGGSVSTHQPSSIVAGEPDAALFAVPASFQEMPPSQAVKANMRSKSTLMGLAATQPVNAATQQLLQGWDHTYLSHRP